MSALDQVAHQGIVRRQVEDIELHDPGRHDQQRHFVHGGADRIVAQQFDQPVLHDDLARRHRDFVPRPVVDHARLAGEEALRVAPGAHGAVDQVHPAAGEHGALHDGVCGDEVRRRHAIEHLARDEGDDVGMVRRDPAHGGGGAVPPLLAQQEPLAELAPGRGIPGRIDEAFILSQWPHRVDRVVGRRGQVLEPALPADDGVGRQLVLLVGRHHEVAGPVEPRHAERGRRQVAGEAAEPGPQHQVGMDLAAAGDPRMAVGAAEPGAAFDPARAAGGIGAGIGTGTGPGIGRHGGGSRLALALSAQSGAASCCRPATSG